eukprot:8127593-Pyramimonas_sp.AAC.1
MLRIALARSPGRIPKSLERGSEEAVERAKWWRRTAKQRWGEDGEGGWGASPALPNKGLEEGRGGEGQLGLDGGA